ncbi:MAG: hypothetical protein ACP5T6_03665 [Candidatus Micrarchaeia archaeon]
MKVITKISVVFTAIVLIVLIYIFLPRILPSSAATQNKFINSTITPVIYSTINGTAFMAAENVYTITASQFLYLFLFSNSSVNASYKLLASYKFSRNPYLSNATSYAYQNYSIYYQHDGVDYRVDTAYSNATLSLIYSTIHHNNSYLLCAYAGNGSINSTYLSSNYQCYLVKPSEALISYIFDNIKVKSNFQTFNSTYEGEKCLFVNGSMSIFVARNPPYTERSAIGNATFKECISYKYKMPLFLDISSEMNNDSENNVTNLMENITLQNIYINSNPSISKILLNTNLTNSSIK